ncbi:MAG: alpha/beta hydrolase [Spirochaetaceae bacterium]
MPTHLAARVFFMCFSGLLFLHPLSAEPPELSSRDIARISNALENTSLKPALEELKDFNQEPEHCLLITEPSARGAAAKTELQEALFRYATFYGPPIPETLHALSQVSLHDRTLAVNLFLSSSDSPGDTRPKGTVVIVHGYLEHGLTNLRLIRFLRQKGYQVAAVDLPGHGLSSGPRADIQSFSHYSMSLEVLTHMLRAVPELTPAPYIAIGHSTGCSAILDTLMKEEQLFDKAILIAPLVRSYLWHLSQFGMTLIRPFTSTIFRRSGGSSRDKDYIKLMREDPLQPEEVPFSWVDALKAWKQQFEEYAEKRSSQSLSSSSETTPGRKEGESTDIHVIQGTEDTVVDWKYSIPLIEKAFSRTKVHFIEDGYHHLLNDLPRVRDEVFALIDVILYGS